VVHPEQNSARDENCYQATHDLIVFKAAADCKIIASVRIEDVNRRWFPSGHSEADVVSAQSPQAFRLTEFALSGNNDR
jgi:hypothetical protein